MKNTLLCALLYVVSHVSTLPPPDCPDGMYFPDTEDCRKFYQCDHGRPVPKTCGPGTYFNTAFNGCDHEYNVKCEDGSSETPEINCNDEQYYFSDPESTSGFYCDNGHWVYFTCPDGLHYNPSFHVCDFPRNSDSYEEVFPDLVCEDGQYFFADPVSCSGYYYCDHGNPVHISCPDGLYYNSSLHICDFRQNVDCYEEVISISACKDRQYFSADPESCSGYYYIDNGYFVHISCPDGLHYNSTHHLCDFPFNVDCCDKDCIVETVKSSSDDIDEEVNPNPYCEDGQMFYTDSVFSSGYYCDNGYLINFSCPGRLYYNPSRHACDFPLNAYCWGKDRINVQA